MATATLSGDAKRLARRHPEIFLFGHGPLPRLTKQEELSADFETRLKSVWQYVVGQCLEFLRHCTAREKANYDLSDILQECAAELLQKDPKWDPARGKYITFAGRLVKHLLSEIKEQNRAVHSPRNVASKMRDLAAEAEEKPEAAKKYHQLRRPIVGSEAFEAQPMAVVTTPDREIGEHIRSHLARRRSLLRDVTTDQAVAMRAAVLAS